MAYNMFMSILIIVPKAIVKVTLEDIYIIIYLKIPLLFAQ